MARKEYVIRKKKYIIITGLIMVMFVLFLSIFELSYTMMNQPKEINNISLKVITNKEKSIKLGMETENKKDPFCIYVADEKDTKRTSYEQALMDLKLPYITCNSFDEITGDMLDKVKVILIGENLENLGNIRRLEAFLNYEISIIFTKIPDHSFIMESSLKDIMGIRKIEGMEKQKGVRLQEGFLLGGRVDLEEYEYTAAMVKLMNSCKIYMCALLEKEKRLEVKNEDLPPLIWRNIYEGRKIFVINGPFLDEISVNGFLAAFFSEIMEDYMYPVIGGIVFAVNNFPYYANADSKELQDFYSRDAQLLQRDILWPDIISVGKREDLQITYYSTDHFTKSQEPTIEDVKKQRDFYSKSLYRSGGQLRSIDSSTWFEKEVYAPVALDGFYLNDKQKMLFYSTLTAFGAIIHRIDMEQIIFPESSDYDWVKASKSMKENIGYYINRYRVLPSKSGAEISLAARTFKVCKPVIEYEENKIHVFTGDSEIDYQFILRTDKKVKQIDFGKVKEMEKGVYLITITTGEANVYLEQNPLNTYKNSDSLKGLEGFW